MNLVPDDDGYDVLYGNFLILLKVIKEKCLGLNLFRLLISVLEYLFASCNYGTYLRYNYCLFYCLDLHVHLFCSYFLNFPIVLLIID